jgi:hypothetical protein
MSAKGSGLWINSGKWSNELKLSQSLVIGNFACSSDRAAYV